MYPCVTVDLEKLGHNVRSLKRLCGQYGIEILGITKVFGGELPIASVLVENGLHMLGDSRIENIKKYRALPCEKWLIRMPGVSEARETVRYCDVSLNSELQTLKALDREAKRQKKIHKAVLMADLGDLREGCIEESDLAECAEFARQAEGLELYGLGTNLTCFSFVQPDQEKLSRLAQLARKYGAGTYVSGGNSATIQLMLQGGIPEGVNSLRLGEALLFGRERSGYQYLPDMYNDAFCVEAEVIECKEKPSMPFGTIGRDSYGKRPEFTDRGWRMRAICAMGRQDVDPETMWPEDEGIEIVGASSDHFVVDITDAARRYEVGDCIRFRLGYFAAMRAFTSRYVKKKYVGGIHERYLAGRFNYIYAGYRENSGLQHAGKGSGAAYPPGNGASGI